jgi:hypothetical protein
MIFGPAFAGPKSFEEAIAAPQRRLRHIAQARFPGLTRG